MRIKLILGGHLREQAGEEAGRASVELSAGSRVQDLISKVGVVPEKVGFVLVNGEGAERSKGLHDGDRVALFPPELSFNTFVRMSFRRRG